MLTMRSVAIVQARIGSKRLPGKVLMKLAGQTVLRHVLQRCAAIEGIDAVCCAVPVGEADDPVAAEALDCGATVTRGSETNVLARYYEAALQNGADVVMRVTSDCPLLDPFLASKVLSLVNCGHAHYACNNMPESWPKGLDCEAFQFSWLERAASEARLSAELEHVTPYLRKHPDVRRAVLHGPGGPIVQHRWTLDTELDMRFLRVVFSRLPSGPEAFHYCVPLAIVSADPDLAASNILQEQA